MPNRYVREGAIESEAVNSLSWQAEVFWRRLINRVDDFGRFTAHLELLRSNLFPLQLAKVSAADITKLLLECEQAGLVSTWAATDGKRYLVLHKSDKGRATTSKYPEPPASISMRLQTSAYRCARLRTDSLGTDSGTDSGTASDSEARARPDATEFAETPSLAEVCCAAEMQGAAKWLAEDFFCEFEAVQWKFRGQQVRNWRALFTKRMAWWREEGAPPKRPTRNDKNERNSKPNPRNVGIYADPNQGAKIRARIDRQTAERDAARAAGKPVPGPT